MIGAVSAKYCTLYTLPAAAHSAAPSVRICWKVEPGLVATLWPHRSVRLVTESFGRSLAPRKAWPSLR
jgi:hypothetical protein